jgi:hypothetical protein
LSKQPDLENLATLKSYLERRLNNAETKATMYRGFIQAIDSILTQMSFKVAADLLKEGKEATVEKTAKGAGGIHKAALTSRVGGTMLGEVTVSGNSMTIVPAQNVNCPTDSGTFNTFFVMKILDNMIEKDKELVKAGKIGEREKMSYQLMKNDDGTLKQIVILNYRDETRLSEITNTIRWTLEKTLEKMSRE